MSEPGPEFLPDDMAIPLAERLLECLCFELGRSLGGPVCACCLRPGGHLPPADWCACGCGDGQGQASVQITSIYPSQRFPRSGVDEWDEPCDSRKATWVAELTMTVYRCVSGLDDEGQPPTCLQLDSDARIIAADAAAMRRAFACCDWHGYARVVPGSWTPVPPQGLCAGGFMTVLVDLGPLCCDTPS
jgi:hypothetical protein